MRQHSASHAPDGDQCAGSASIVIAREDPRQDDVAALIAALDAYHATLYPAESNHHLDLETLARDDIRFFVARDDGRALGCAALRIVDGYGEVKRMYVHPAARGAGLGRQLLAAVETAARALRLPVLRLETGIRQAEAVALYTHAGFRDRAAFGEYAPDPLSRYLEKPLD